MKRERYKSLRTISREEPLGPGGPLCAGCGGQLSLRLFHKALGANVIFVNAASCSTLFATYPFTPLNSSWIYTAMACAPAGAQGVRDALDMLLRRGKLAPDHDRKVVVLTGDGAAQDIGLQSTMAAIHRGLDFYYFCYDNESYGNTGFQTSASTPTARAHRRSRRRLPRPTEASADGAICLKSGACKSRPTSPPFRPLIRWIFPKRFSAPRSTRGRSFSSPIRPARSVGKSIRSGRWKSRALPSRPASGRSKKRSTASSHTPTGRGSSSRWKIISSGRDAFAICSNPRATTKPSRTFKKRWMHTGKRRYAAPPRARGRMELEALRRRKLFQPGC